MTKNEIRNHMKRLRNQLSDEEQQQLSRSIHKKLYSLEEYKQCDAIFIYVSFGKEVETLSVIEEALRLDKYVYIPKVEGNELKFYQIQEIHRLTRSNFGILEPDKNIHGDPYLLDDKPQKNLMIMPGLAFDGKGNRIGYGAGYYDRYLASFPLDHFCKIAFAYDFQVVAQIPVEEYDITMDRILTPSVEFFDF